MEYSQTVTKLDEQVWRAWLAKNARLDRERARRRWKLFGMLMIFVVIAMLLVLKRY